MPVQCTRKNVKISGCRNVLWHPYHNRKIMTSQLFPDNPHEA